MSFAHPSLDRTHCAYIKIAGIAVPWNSPARDRPCVYRPGSLGVRVDAQTDSFVKMLGVELGLRRGDLPILAHHREDQCVGWVNAIEHVEVGLRIEGHILRALLPDDMLTLIGADALPHLSAGGVQHLGYEETRHGGEEPSVVTRAILSEVSLTYTPAYGGTQITVIEEGML